MTLTQLLNIQLPLWMVILFLVIQKIGVSFILFVLLVGASVWVWTYHQQKVMSYVSYVQNEWLAPKETTTDKKEKAS